MTGYVSIKLHYVPQFRLPSNRTVQSYSGYLTVNKKACGSNLFFWFFPAQQSPATAPVVLWLQVCVCVFWFFFILSLRRTQS